MKMMDCVEVIVEKETYVKDGVHKGMQGWICLEQIVNEDHYKEGTCRGLWFANINSLEEKSKLDYNPEEEVQIVENVTNFIQLLTLLARLGGTNSNMSSMSRNSFNNNNNKCQQCKIVCLRNSYSSTKKG